jgi:FAD/FMN-containing dehydrogenase
MTTFATTAVDGLRSALLGTALTTADPAYDEARTLFNAMIDKRPAVIAQCAGPDDVAAALAFARQHRLEVGVRGGGHGVAGTALSDGGLVIDLSRMNAVTVDPDARTARVGGGATMSNLDRATEPHGLAVTGGRVSTTGVGGFTLGGGTGWLDRKFGLACDNLLSVELVTADGRQVVASEEENPELFWALHGGGGNFGVATSLTLRLHEVPTFSVALLMWDPAAGESVVRTFRDMIESGPDELGGGVIYLTAPPEEFVPEHMVGKLAALSFVTYAGAEAGLRELAAPLLDLDPAVELVMELPYAEAQCMIDDPPGNRNYWSAEHLSSLPDDAVSAFVAMAESLPVPTSSQHVLFPAGGATARSTADYPLPWRTAPWVVHPFAVWADPADDDRAREWVRNVRSAVRPWATGDVYLNFIGNEGSERVRAGFGEDAWRRLVAVKREFDPDNVFHLNHNIDPS